MNMTQEASALLDNYLHAVEKRLPFRKRDDIIGELHSGILDSLEELQKSRNQGREEQNGQEQNEPESPIDEDAMAEFLKQFGSPAKVAAQYHEQTVIISPAYYPLFTLIASIVFGVLFVFFGVGIVVDAVKGDFSAVSFLESLAGLWTGAASTFGILVIVFILLTRYLPENDIPFSPEQEEKEWDPKTLPPAVYQKPPKTAESIASIVFETVFIVLFAFFAEEMAVRWNYGEICIFIPALGPAFIAFIPLLVIRWSLGILLHIFLLIKGIWLTSLKIFEIFLSFFDVAMLIYLISQPADTIIRFDLMQRTEIADVVPVLRGIFYALLAFLLVLSLYEAGKGIWGLVKKSHTSYSSAPKQ